MKNYRAITTSAFIILFVIVLSTEASWLVQAAPPAQQSELAFITSPTDNEIVRGVISIRGSAAHPGFDRYQMAYAKEPVGGNNAWVLIGIERRVQVVNGELAIWDTRTVPDGSYSLRLRVVRNDGNYAETETRQIVVANSQPTETPTPNATPTPTVTPTPLPPTPTIVIEQPIVDTPTPRPLAQVGALPTPRPTNSGTIPIPNVIFDTAPLKSGCLWGGGSMLLVFLLFGFLSAFRTFVLGFADRTRGRRQ
ncbi:MAG: hypothetical protein AAF629_16305 [Chloroflexota bacterium]